MQRVFWSGRVRLSADRRRGSELAFCAKIGSSGVVKLYQNRTFRGIVARMGDFFLRFAEQNPDVLGGRELSGSRWLHFFGFEPPWVVSGKIEEHTS